MKKSLVVIVSVALLLSCFIGFGAVGAKKKPVKIGLLVPMTGTQAVFGEDMLAAAKLAVKEANEAGGVMGRPLELVVEDTETRPTPGMNAAKKLVEVNEVPILTGGFSSGVSLPIAKYAQKQGTPYLLAVPTSPLFRDVGENILSVTVVDTFKGKAISNFAVEDSGKDEYALMFMNNAFGQKLMEATEDSLEELGAEVVTKVSYELGKVDYKAELKRLFSEDPEAIIGTWYAKEGLVTIKQAYQLGLVNPDEVPWYVAEVTTSFADALEKVPKALEGIKGLDPLEPKQLFSNKFEEKTGDEPVTAFAAQYYDAVRMIAMAMNFANSTKPEAIRKALFNIDDWYRGVSYGGDKRFDEDGMQAHAAFRKVIIEDGELHDYVQK